MFRRRNGNKSVTPLFGNFSQAGDPDLLLIGSIMGIRSMIINGTLQSQKVRVGKYGFSMH